MIVNWKNSPMTNGQLSSQAGAESRDAAAEAISLAARAETLAREAAAAAVLEPEAADENEAATEARFAKADAAARKAKYLAAQAVKFAEEAGASAAGADGDVGAAAAARTAMSDAKMARALAVKATKLLQARAQQAAQGTPDPLERAVPVPSKEPAAPRPVAFPELPTATAKPRHWAVLASFVLIVALPILGTAWLLWGRAADQYASYVGFLVRSEQNNASLDALSGLTQLAQNSGSDTDILYKFIQSQSLVEEVARQVDLPAIWSKHPGDVIFGYGGSPRIEDLVRHWNRMVKIYYDKGMLDLRILAYDPADAKLVADMILAESQKRLDAINAVARQDAMKYAQEDLTRAIDRLKEARQAISAFRNENQIIDPTSATAEQAGIVATLQQQLAEALVQLDMLRVNAPEGDPRIVQGELRVNSIRDQISEQRNKIGSDQMEAAALAEIVSQFEALQVDRQFAEETYTAALAAYDSARASADRRALYLAAYVHPTLATTPEYPHRMRFLIVVAGFLLLIWVIGTMFYYGSRDRRR